jgi:DNA-binding transcriptional ArsR family regulator
MTTIKPAVEQTVMTVLGDLSEAAAAEIAITAGLARSTVSKTLVKLESAGKVRRSEGGRDGARRLPDRWRLTRRRARPTCNPADSRLRPGELDGLVLAYMNKHAKGKPLGPTAVANGLERSSGAVGNCLARLAHTGKVRQTGERPRRYESLKKQRARS